MDGHRLASSAAILPATSGETSISSFSDSQYGMADSRTEELPEEQGN
jgi:hypothetical protein